MGTQTVMNTIDASRALQAPSSTEKHGGNPLRPTASHKKRHSRQGLDGRADTVATAL